MCDISQIPEWCSVTFNLDPLVRDRMNASGNEDATTEVTLEPPFQSWLPKALRGQEWDVSYREKESSGDRTRSGQLRHNFCGQSLGVDWSEKTNTAWEADFELVMSLVYTRGHHRDLRDHGLSYSSEE